MLRKAAPYKAVFIGSATVGIALNSQPNYVDRLDTNRDGGPDTIGAKSLPRGTASDGVVDRLCVLLNDGHQNLREHAITLKDSKAELADLSRGQVGSKQGVLAKPKHVRRTFRVIAAKEST